MEFLKEKAGSKRVKNGSLKKVSEQLEIVATEENTEPESIRDTDEKNEWYQWYLEEIRTGLKSKAKRKTQLYFKDIASEEYKEVSRSIKDALEAMSEIDNTVFGESFLHSQAKALVRSQEIFESIKRDLEILDIWSQGNPWHCLNLRARQALDIGFVKKLSVVEAEKAEAGVYPGSYIKFQNRLNGRYYWVFIALCPEPTDTERALFNLLHKLRIKCGEVARSHRN